MRKSHVNVINETVANSETAPVEFTLRSMNGQVNTVMEAFTINDVTGNLKTVFWKAINRNWDHFRGVTFSQVNSRSNSYVDWSELSWLSLLLKRHQRAVVEGDDVFVRAVEVQVGGWVVARSITKICPLEVNEGNQNVTTWKEGMNRRDICHRHSLRRKTHVWWRMK